MRWIVDFYNVRRGVVARYRVDAASPAAAAASGRQAVHAEYPVMTAPGSVSLFARAERVGGQDGSGWVLYRMRRDDEINTRVP